MHKTMSGLLPMKHRLIRPGFFFLVVTLLLACSFAVTTVPVVQAASFNIADGDVAGLIAALNAPGAPHTINLAPAGTYSLAVANNGIAGSNGLPVINTQITINGNGATIIRAGGAPNFRFFYVTIGGNLTVNNLTLTNGNASDPSNPYGGAIFNEFGAVTIVNSIFSNNQSSIDGGAVFNGSFSGIPTTPSLTVANSTFSNNTASFGGALYNISSVSTTTANIINSTFYQNTVNGNGGAINNYGTGAAGGRAVITIVNSTLANNSATGGLVLGGGIVNYQDNNGIASATLQNTLLVGNVGGNCAISNAPFAPSNNNLEFPGPAITCGPASTLAGTNPLGTATPANNGGPTPTIALPGGSQAIGAGGAGCLAVDQRYFSRTPGPCDIGAFQANGTSSFVPLIKAFNPVSIDLGGTTTLTLTFNNPYSFALINISFTDTMPTQLQVVAAPLNNCGSGTLSAPIGSNIIALTGLNLPIGAPACSITIQITSNVKGNYINTTGLVTAKEFPVGLPSNSANLGVGNPAAPSIRKAFGADSIALKGSTSLTFTITNPNSTSLSGISFNDPLPDEMVVAEPNTLSENCGGTVTATALSNSITLTGGILAANATCTISLNVVVQTSGVKNNQTGPISSTESGTGGPSNIATLLVGVTPELLRADLIGQLRVTPDRFAATDETNLITYTLSLKNIGPAQANSVSLRFPLDPALALGFASFSDSRMWVSAIVSDTNQPYIQIGMPTLEARSQNFTGTITFRPVAKVSPGAIVFTRYQIYWDDVKAGNKSVSNAVRYSFNSDKVNRDDSGGAIQLFNPSTATVASQAKISLMGDFYIPGEIVNLWYTNKSGTSFTLGTRQADNEGKLIFEFNAATLNLTTSETYTVVGFGNRSEISGSTVLKVVNDKPVEEQIQLPKNGKP